MTNFRDRLILPLSHYAAPEYKKVLDKLEDTLGIDHHFKGRFILAERLIELFSFDLNHSESLQSIKKETLCALKSVLEDDQYSTPPTHSYNKQNLISGTKIRYPVPALIFAKLELIGDSKHKYELGLTKLLCDLLCASIFRHNLELVNFAYDIRSFISDRACSPLPLAWYAQIGCDREDLNKAIDKANRATENGNLNSKEKRFIKVLIRLFDVHLEILSQSDAPQNGLLDNSKGSEIDHEKSSKHWIQKCQFLTPNDYRRLTAIERKHFVSALVSALKGDCDSERNSAGLLFISYLTGQYLEDVFNFKKSTTGEITEHGLYRRKISRPVDGYTPDFKTPSQLAVADEVLLPFPEFLQEWLAHIPVRKQCILNSLFKGKEDATEGIKRLLRKIRKFPQCQRIKMDKVPAALHLELQLLYRDESLSFLLASKPSQAHAYLGYYVSHEIQRLKEAYNKATQNLLTEDFYVPSDPNPLSESCDAKIVTLPHPSRNDIDCLRKSILNEISLAKDCKNIIEIHNRYTDYCLSLLFLATGHRPVEDPFGSLEQIDLENGLIAISDKSTSASSIWRIAALSNSAVKQVEYYLSYLKALPSKLFENQALRNLAHKLEAALSEKSSNFPLFFYLDDANPHQFISITQKILKEQFKNYWRWPVNFTRHILATELMKLLPSGDLVKIQLGHIYGPQHPFGVRSTISCLDALNIIRPCIESFLLEHDWRPIVSPIRKTTSLPKLAQPIQDPKRKLGYEKRQKVSEMNKAAARHHLKQTIVEHFHKRKISQLNVDELTFLEELYVTKRDKQKLTQRCLAKIRKELALRLSKTREFASARSEATPFSALTLKYYADAQSLRSQFLSYLNKQSLSDIELYTRLAEITVSAALLGGMSYEPFIQRLPSMLNTSLFKIDDSIIIDFTQCSDDPEYRYQWSADAITSGLILAYLKITNGKSYRFSTSKFTKALSQLLLSLHVKANYPSSYLAHSANCLAIIELPGCLRGYTNRTYLTASLPLKVVTRLSSDQSLAHENIKEELARKRNFTKLPLILSGKNTGKNLLCLKKDLRKINKDISSLAFAGNEKRDVKQKNHLLNAINELFTSENNWSLQAGLVADYALSMIKNGTKATSDPAYSTVRQYLGTIIKVLLPLDERPIGVDLFQQNAVFWEEVYCDALSRTSGKSKDVMCTVIKAFHGLLCESYGFEDIEWSIIFAAAQSSSIPFNIDANFISESEYLDLIATLSTLDFIDEHERLQLIALVVLGYRAALRYFEAFGLLARDVIDNECLEILIQQNIIRGLKSENGKRAFVSNESLHDVEKQALEALIISKIAERERDELTPLFNSQNAVGRQLISPSRTIDIIHKCLRGITGDGSLRFHHFRHSYVGRQFSQKFESLREAYGKQDIENFNTNIYPLRHIATAVGHSDELTTLTSYTHCHSELLRNTLTDFSSHLTDAGRDYCLANKSGAALKRRSRGNKSESFSALTINKRVSKLISTPPFETQKKREVTQAGLDLNVAHTEVTLIGIANKLLWYSQSAINASAIENCSMNRFFDSHSVFDAAAQVEINSGFSIYNLFQKQNDALSYSEAHDVVSHFNREAETRFYKALENLQNCDCLDKKLKDLNHALNLWVDTFDFDSQTNLVLNAADATSLKVLFEFIKSNVELSVKFSQPTIKDTWPAAFLSDVVTTVGKLPARTAKIKALQQMMASLKINALSDRRLIHRVIFILNIYLKLITSSESMMSEQISNNYIQLRIKK
ncbi:hypothetical protein [Alteromonas facilis]|uniref:hypothetical protein n=1 Tax=Alteromonas facilis TaxID=2048004 RepID=UPI000C284875|nr:hypothetical protein [Alteromonas facilis]